VAKENQNIDNLFKGALSNYTQVQPSGSVWRGISGKMFLHDLMHFRLLNIPYFVPAALVAIAGIMAILFFTTGPAISPMYEPRDGITTLANEETLKTEGRMQVAEESRQLAGDSQQSTGSNQESKIKNQEPVLSEAEVSTITSQQSTGSNNKSQITNHESQITNQQKAYNPIVLKEKTNLIISTDEILKPLAYLSIHSIQARPEPYPEFAAIPNKEVTGARTAKGSFDYFTKDRIAVGLHFSPEKMFNAPDDQPDNNIYSAELSFIYQMNKYIFQTGIGYTYYENDYNYRVNYNDFLGTFNELVSIDFTYDSINGTPVPNYTWKTTDVFDTTDLSISSTVTNYYSTLELPLLIGYELLKKNRFSLFVKGGPTVSFLVYKNEPGAAYYSPDRKVTSIDYTNPSRTKVNWQFQGSIGLGYQFSRKFSVAVEPMIKYYFNQVYGRNSSSDTNPYLLGIRTGIIYSIK